MALQYKMASGLNARKNCGMWDRLNLKVVSELLGPSSVAITADIYASVLPEQQQEVVNKMDDLFKRS